MKALAWLLLNICLAITSHAQSPAGPQASPQVEILKYNWTKELLGWERDPFSPTVENYDDVRLRVRDERRLEEAKKAGNRAEANKLERLGRAKAEASKRQTAPPRYAFMYRVSVKNTGTKVIKTLDWDYIFFDKDSQTEVGRHQFTSQEKINPGKNKELNVFLPVPPTKTISVNELNKKERLSLKEQVIIVRVEYSDGSVWQRE